MRDEDTLPGQVEAPRRKRLQFDPTINAGHLLTFASVVAALFVGWSTLDKRVVVLEEAKAYQRERDLAQDVATGEKLSAIKDAVLEVKRGVEELRRGRP